MADDLNLKVKITANSKEAQKAIDELAGSIDDLSSDGKSVSDSLNDAESSAKDFGDQVDEASSKVDELVSKKSSIEDLGTAFKSIGREIKSLGSTLTVVTAPLTAIAGLGLKNIFDIGGSITASEGPFRNFAENVRTLKDNFTELTIEVSERLLPSIQPLINFSNNLIAAFRRLDDGTKELLIAIGGVAVATGPVLIVFGSLVETFGRLLTLAKPIAAALSSIGVVLSAKVVVIGSVVAGVAGLINTFLKLREVGVGAVEAITTTLDLVLGAALKFVVGNILKAINVVLDALSKLARYASDTVADSLQAISDDIRSVGDYVAEPFDSAKAKIDDKLEGMGSSAASAFTFGFSDKISELKDSFSGMFEEPDLSDLSNENATRLDSLKAGYDSMGVTVDQVNRRIEQSISNTLTDGIVGLIDGTKSLGQAFSEMANKVIQDLIRIMIQAQITNAVAGSLGAPSSGGGGLFGFATGGYVSGPGSSMSDSIPARLSNGEYVIRASSVKKVGVGFLDYINNLGSRSFKKKIDGNFADGGSVGSGVGSLGEMKVEIINKGAGKQSTEASFDAEKMVVSVVLEDLGRNGSLSKAIGSTFGMRRTV